MSLGIDSILLVGSILLFISIVGSKLISKLGVPTLLLFLFIGIIAGSEGIGGIYFDDPRFAQSTGVIALTMILFSGGLDTKWESIQPIWGKGISLATAGVFITALSLGLFAHLILDFTLIEGLLLGSIVSSTDAAAVFSELKSKKMGLKRNLRPLLELESGSNDPMAYFLTVSFTFLLINEDSSILHLIPSFFIEMTFGGLFGFIMGKMLVWIINSIKLEIEGLYSVLTLALAFFTYAATDYLNGNGFLAVYIAGMVLGNNNFIHKRTILKFYDGIAWLMQILMFITLGLLVFPSQLIPIIGSGLLMSFFLILISRPLGVFLSLFFVKMGLRDKVFVSWVGLRGAVPIVFATYPLIEGVGKADTIFNLVFFIVITSVGIQGTTLSVMAKWLKLDTPEKLKKKYPLELELSNESKNELFKVKLDKNSKAAGKPIVDLEFPKGSLIVLISRDGKYITPNGVTKLEAGDKLQIMAANREEIPKIISALK
ncbi:MAG TPA: potassium/proton antiporter [Cytophagales bacterium]|nr:potassium/proton antiporter [Cytophagales bacterium]